MTLPNVDSTTLNNLSPNLDVGDVADPALRLSVFQYIYSELQVIVNELNNIPTANLQNLAVTSAKLADLAVATGKIADLAVTTSKINDLAVTLAKMAANSVGTTQLVDSAVTAAKIANGVLTASKFVEGALQNETQNGLEIVALKADKAEKTKWKNKVGVALGDSITWQDGQPYAGSGLIARGYLTLLKEQKGISEYRNYGQSGKSMSGFTSGDTTVIGKTLSYSDVDFVTIFAGTNDFKLNKKIGPLGVIGDTSFNTDYFIGAYRSLIEYILTQKPTIKIFLFTPLQRDNSSYDVNFVNPANHKLADYVKAVKRVGAMYSLPVLDLYAVSGLTKKNFSTYTNQLDGLHPNDAGYLRITEAISPFIETAGFNSGVDVYEKKVYKGNVVYDSFNRPDTNILGTPDITPDNAPWEIIAGNNFAISGNKTVFTTTSTNIVAVDTGISDNCEISVTFPEVAIDRRIYFRILDATNNLLVTITSGNVYRIIRVLAGNATTLATGTTTAVNGDTIKVKLTGTTIKLYVNGTLELTVTDANFTTATKHGIGSAGSITGSFDEFLVVAI